MKRNTQKRTGGTSTDIRTTLVKGLYVYQVVSLLNSLDERVSDCNFGFEVKLFANKEQALDYAYQQAQMAQREYTGDYEKILQKNKKGIYEDYNEEFFNYNYSIKLEKVIIQ